MSWISIIPYDKATGRLLKLYDRLKGSSGGVDNIMQAHSLRPHTMEGHMALYKNVLHHSANTLPLWFLEAVGVYTSALNGCEYCVRHHSAGLRRELGNDAKADAMIAALEADAPEGAFEGSDLAALIYTRKLSLAPAELVESDLENMRASGLGDGEILEINQVVAYFAYANRTVLGLGVSLAGDTKGIAPRGGDDDWGHT